MARRADGSKYNLESIDRMGKILTAMESGPEQTLEQIASASGLNDSTALRYLLSLEKHGLVERNETSGRFRFGLRLFRLGNLAIGQRDILRIATPVMQRLGQDFEELVNFATRQQGQVMLLKVLESNNPTRKGARAGETDSWHATALGKAFLASYDADEVTLLLGGGEMVRYTPNTLTSRETLDRDLISIRERGYAIDDEESVEGLRCIGVAIRDHNGTSAYAMSVSGPKSRMSYARMQQIGSSLVEAAAGLSRDLGSW